MAKTREQPPAAPAFEMPPACVGLPVVWYPGQGDGLEATAALVTRVGRDNVALTVWGPGFHNGDPRDGVRHRDDPDHEAVRNSEQGVWDYTDAHKMLLRLREELGGK